MSGFVIPGSNSSVVLDAIKESFYFISVFIEVFINASGVVGILSGRNYHLSLTFFDKSSKDLAVISFVSYHGSGLILTQKSLSLAMIRILSWRQDKTSGVAKSITSHMQLGRKATPATT